MHEGVSRLAQTQHTDEPYFAHTDLAVAGAVVWKKRSGGSGGRERSMKGGRGVGGGGGKENKEEWCIDNQQATEGR